MHHWGEMKRSSRKFCKPVQNILTLNSPQIYTTVQKQIKLKYGTMLKKRFSNHATLLTADIISTVEFNHSGELLATGDKGGRVVIFQQEPEVSHIISYDYKCVQTVQMLSFTFNNFLNDQHCFCHT